MTDAVRGGGRRARPWVCVAAAALVLLEACARGSGTPPASTPRSSPSAGPGGTTVTPSPSLAVSPAPSPHVVLIVMENKEFASVIGSPQAPYLNALAGRYGLATRYDANTHPSLPNYLDLLAGKDFGIHDDGESYVLPGPTLVDQLGAAGLSWRAYMEGMPADATAPCLFPTGGDRYHKKHDPFAYFSAIQDRSDRCRDVVPYSRLGGDRTAGLRNFTWITPDACNDMHDCSIQTGDAWLARNVPPILAGLSGTDLLFIVFDEGSSSEGGGGHVACIVAGPGARTHASSDVPYSHFSLLRTIEDVFGLVHLAHAGDPGVHPMADLLRPAADGTTG